MRRPAARRASATRPKQPYRAPESQSFVGSSAPPSVLDRLSPADIDRPPAISMPRAVEKLVQKCRALASIGFRDNMAFVGILSTQLWHETFVPPVTLAQRLLRRRRALAASRSREATSLVQASSRHGDDIKHSIREFIEDNFLFREDRAELADDRITAGRRPDRFHRHPGAGRLPRSRVRHPVADAEIVPDNLDSIRHHRRLRRQASVDGTASSSLRQTDARSGLRADGDVNAR